LPHETIWGKFEEVFTNNYSICEKDYVEYWTFECWILNSYQFHSSQISEFNW
jgi:hypothetical protein